MIEEYHFGSITIDGKTYNYDVEVRWAPKETLRDSTGQADEVLKWQRLESHVIDAEDVKRAIEQNPETIIIGNGESGVARVSKEAKKFIKEKGVELIIDITWQAVKTFNILVAEASLHLPPHPSSRGSAKEESKEEEEKQRRVIGLFHLTC